MNVVRLPKMGLSMEEGVILRFAAEPGMHCKKGDLLVEVETDKAVLEVEMPYDGVIEEHLVQTGDTVPVGAPLIKLIAAAGAVPETRKQAIPIPPLAESTEPDIRLIAISPSARRRARELNVDYSQLQGSGPGGRIIHLDIEEAVLINTAKIHKDQKIELSRIKRIVAKRMVESVRTIPQF